MPLKEREKEHARAARFDADEAIKDLELEALAARWRNENVVADRRIAADQAEAIAIRYAEAASVAHSSATHGHAPDSTLESHRAGKMMATTAIALRLANCRTCGSM